MYTSTKKVTLYLDPTIHTALKMKAAQSGLTTSDEANQMLAAMLAEDLEDMQSVDERAGDTTVSYEEFLEQLRQQGSI